MSLGFVFPGQGAQAVGMLSEFSSVEPSIKARFEEASEAIGAPLDEYVWQGPEETLNLTEFTQPAVLTASAALWDIWQRRDGPTPSLLAGHSLGEYTALVCSGALSFEEGVRLVHLRGKYMQQAVPAGEGAIAAVLGLTDEQIAACCKQAPGLVSPANYNAPGQVAIAGEHAAVQSAIEACKAAGAKRAVMLNLSVPVHCALMSPAGEQLKAAIEDCHLTLPQIPIVHNLDAQIAKSLDDLKEKLLGQLANPVQWTRCVEKLAEQGVDRVVECGPGKVLTGLIKRIDRSLLVTQTDSNEAMKSSLDANAADGGS